MTIRKLKRVKKKNNLDSDLNTWWNSLTPTQQISIRKRFERCRKKTKSERILLKNISNENGRWRLHYIVLDNGRYACEAFIKINDKYYRGFANCLPTDVYLKNLARVIALGKAWKNYYKYDNPTSIENIPKVCLFGEDV